MQDRQAGDASQAIIAPAIYRGVARLFHSLGFACASEITLGNSRRADVMAISGDGAIVIVEIKSGAADFRADTKWPEYLDYCDRFYFAAPPEMNLSIFPEQEGLISADNYGANILREAQVRKLAPARRRALQLNFLHCAANRLNMILDPGFRISN